MNEYPPHNVIITFDTEMDCKLAKKLLDKFAREYVITTQQSEKCLCVEDIQILVSNHFKKKLEQQK